MAEVIKSIEREAFIEAQSQKFRGDISGGYLTKTPCISKDNSIPEDELAIEADIEADRREIYERLYRQEPIEPNNKKCNLAFCRYNTDRECTNDEERKECVELMKKVLCIK